MQQKNRAMEMQRSRREAEIGVMLLADERCEAREQAVAEYCEVIEDLGELLFGWTGLYIPYWLPSSMAEAM